MPKQNPEQTEHAEQGVAEQTKRHWHTLPVEEVESELETATAEGLTAREAARRLRHYGPNRLRATKGTPWWQVLLGQFRSVVVLLLVSASVVSFGFGHTLEGISIVVVILLNTGIGFFTEYRADRAMEALQKLGAPEATVLRGKERRRVNAADVVPGDVLVLQEGESVVADARVAESAELRVDESSLTGESIAVTKSTDAMGDEDTPLADRENMVYKGTYVAQGNGTAVVVATGAATQIGHVSELVSGVEEEETPLEKRLDQMGRRLIGVCLAVAAVVAVSGIAQGVELARMLEAAIALAVAAVPEGLPAVATITLAVGMQRMAKRNALIRRLPAVETLGSATCVCTDKTGTLTRSEMALVRLWVPDRELEVSGSGYSPEGRFTEGEEPVEPREDPQVRPLLVIGALCNNAGLHRDDDGNWAITGDPTEAALVVAARKAGMAADDLRNTHEELKEFAFSSSIMMMGTVNDGLDDQLRPNGGRALCVKGAPNVVLEHCERVLNAEGVRTLSDSDRQGALQMNERLAADGLRMLACAYRPVEQVPAEADETYRDLVFVGLIGIMDPPRDEARETVDLFTEAGVKTVMITGDQSATAANIATRLHIMPEGAPVLTGRDLAGMDGESLVERLQEVEVFARVSPEQKVDILKGLQQRGEICAMLGDGVNDAIALKRADIGVAMGIKGTDVAKETSDMVLLDDRFATVGAAVEQGRIIYANIKKFIHYLFSCNLSEMLTMLGASLLSPLLKPVIGTSLALPLLPLQILWLNLITDVFPALALAMEPGEAGIMRRPPRDPEEALLNREMIGSIAGYGALITVATIAAFVSGFFIHAGQQDVTGRAVTMSFLTIAFAQLFHVFTSRKERHPMAWGEWTSNPFVLGAIALTIGLQMAAVYMPGLNTVLKTQPPAAIDWLIIALCSTAPLVIGQLYRHLRYGTEPEGA